MDANLVESLKDALRKSNNVGIAVGSNPSLDQMAAALSLYLSLSKANKKTIIASPTSPIVEISSLVGIDKVQTSLTTNTGDLIVSFPYNEGEIDKVSYTLDNNLLNIVVKSGEKGLSFNEKDVKYTRGGGIVDLLFIIGTAKISDLTGLLTNDNLKNTKTINIDNKQENEKFGDIVIVSENASSVSEQIAELLVELGFAIDQDIAQNLLSGLIAATDNFRNPNSSALAFATAGFLMKKGATRGQDKSASSFMSRSQIQPQPIQPAFEEKPVEKIQSLKDVEKAPLDWLTPKVYKGSSGVSTS